MIECDYSAVSEDDAALYHWWTAQLFLIAVLGRHNGGGYCYNDSNFSWIQWIQSHWMGQSDQVVSQMYQFSVCVTEAHPAQTYQKEQEEEQAEASQKVSSCLLKSIFKLFIAF